MTAKNNFISFLHLSMVKMPFEVVFCLECLSLFMLLHLTDNCCMLLHLFVHVPYLLLNDADCTTTR